MAKRKRLSLRQIAEEYGSLNDLTVSEASPTADRRTLSPTTAIATVIGDYYTPDVLSDKDEFLGVVLASIPSQVPRLSAKSQQLEVYSQTIRQARQNNPLFYTYKVFIPELESRCLEFSQKSTGKTTGTSQPLSLAQRVATMQDVSLDVTLFGASAGSRAIQPGTLVKVTYEDLATMKGPKIVAIFKKVFNFTAVGTTKSNENKFNEGQTPPSVPKKLAAEGRNEFFWSGGRSQHKSTYIAQDNTRIEVGNGALEGVRDGDGKGNLILQAPPNGGPLMIPQAHKDWEDLTTAYYKRFKQPLKALGNGGYRSYQGQVKQRLLRIRCGAKGEPLTKPLDLKTQPAMADIKGSKSRAGIYVPKNGECKKSGPAAKPGTSRHGWGVAVDLDRSSYYGSNKRSDQNEGFRWLNKYGVQYNWVFNVGSEPWHIVWMPAGKHFVGGQSPKSLTKDSRAAKFNKPECGITDDPGHAGYVAEYAPAATPPAGSAATTNDTSTDTPEIH